MSSGQVPGFLDSHWTGPGFLDSYQIQFLCEIWKVWGPSPSILQDDDRILHQLMWSGPNPLKQIPKKLIWIIADVCRKNQTVLICSHYPFLELVLSQETTNGVVTTGVGKKATFLSKCTLRVQTAPFDKIAIDFWRSRRRLYIPDLLKAKKLRRQIIIF